MLNQPKVATFYLFMSLMHFIAFLRSLFLLTKAHWKCMTKCFGILPLILETASRTTGSDFGRVRIIFALDLCSISPLLNYNDCSKKIDHFTDENQFLWFLNGLVLWFSQQKKMTVKSTHGQLTRDFVRSVNWIDCGDDTSNAWETKHNILDSNFF